MKKIIFILIICIAIITFYKDKKATENNKNKNTISIKIQVQNKNLNNFDRDVVKQIFRRMGYEVEEVESQEKFLITDSKDTRLEYLELPSVGEKKSYLIDMNQDTNKTKSQKSAILKSKILKEVKMMKGNGEYDRLVYKNFR